MPAGTPYQFLDSRDLVAQFNIALEAANEALWAQDISPEIASSRETEEYGWLGQVPVMRKWIGGRNEVTLNKYTLSIRNYPYEATMPVSVPDLRRDKTGQINQRIMDLATRTATHWNSLLGTLITNGEAGTSGLAYDGQYFFDTDHAESGSSQTNDLTATEVPSANVGTTTTLTSTEAANIINETIAYMSTLTDDQGEPINQGPKDVTILCTYAGHLAGLTAAGGLNNLGSATDNNPVSILKSLGFNIRVQLVVPRVTQAAKLYFFFGSPGMNNAPLIRQSETGVITSVLDETFRNNRYLFGVNADRGAGYGMWQRAALVTLS